MARANTLRQRATSAAGTRQRILDAGRDLLINDGLNAANISAIAAHAGVTRGTVYMHFASPHELLLAVLNDALDRADVRFIRKALHHPDAAEAARLLMAGSTRFWVAERYVFSRIKGLAMVDAEFARLDELKEAARAGHTRNLAIRLVQQRRLRAGVSELDAYNTIFFLCSFEAVEHCTRVAGLSVQATALQLRRILDTTVLA